MSKIKLKNPKEFLNGLKKRGQPFQLISTTLTKTILTDSTVYYYTTSNSLKPIELSLIKQVKDYVINNNLSVKCKKESIQYINKNSNLKKGIYSKDIFEIDLNKAYWNYFYKNKYTSEEIYLKGLNEKLISKKARLISLGNLAKKQIIFDFNGREYLEPTFKSSDTENLFFKVSQQTDKVMNELKFITGNDFLFYWVDAIFVRGVKARDLVIDYLKLKKLEFKLILIDRLQNNGNYVTVTDNSHLYKVKTLKNDILFNVGDLKPRPFIFEPLKSLDLRKILNNNFQ